MRYILSILTVAVLALPAMAAQTDSGNLEVTAGNIIGYTWVNDDTFSQNTDHNFFIGFNDMIFGLSYFAADNFAIGGTFSFRYTSDKETDTNSKNVNINPHLKFYVPISDALYWYLSATAGYTWSKYNGVDPSYRFSLGANTGVTFMVTDYLGIYVGAYYDHFFNQRMHGLLDGDSIDKTAYDRVRATCGLTVFFGDGVGSGSSSSSSSSSSSDEY